jgi:hypothetical protein
MAAMLRNEWYLDEPELQEARLRCWRILDQFDATRADENEERRLLLVSWSPSSVTRQSSCPPGWEAA